MSARLSSKVLPSGSVLGDVISCRVEVMTLTIPPISRHSGLFGGLHGLGLNPFFCSESWSNQSLPRGPRPLAGSSHLLLRYLG